MLHSSCWSKHQKRPDIIYIEVKNLKLQMLTNWKDNRTITQASGENENVN